MREQRLYSSKGELASRNWKARVTLGGREKKIKHFIPSSPNSFPTNSNHQKESRQTDALAFSCRHVLHGVRRNLRDRSDHFWRGLRPRHSGAVVSPSAVVLADGVHDRRIVERTAAGRRLLRLGSPGPGQFLGLSGSVAFAGRQHF